MPQTGQEKVVVVQDGTRLHYAVPVGLQRRGALERVYTDWYAKGGVFERVASAVAGRIRRGSGRRLLERHSAELDARRVYRSAGLVVKQARARKRFASPEAHWAWCSETLGEWILSRGFGGGTAVHGFVRNISPGLCNTARSRGLSVVVDQMIAPMHEEHRQWEIQRERFPEWATTPPGFAASDAAASGAAAGHAAGHAAGGVPEAVQRIEEATWSAAHHVTCASEYVRRGLVEAGVGAEKVTVLPYPLDASRFSTAGGVRVAGPRAVTAGFVGAVGLRKGVPYLLQVAARLPGVQFELVGPMTVPPGVLGASPNVSVVGTLPRSAIAERMAGWDMFVFPSTCEGSAVAVMEAMASGLPVVTSPNSGAPIRDGVEGFVRAYDDVEGLAGAVERLAGDRALRRDMGQAGREAVARQTIDAYADGLLRIFREIRKR